MFARLFFLLLLTANLGLGAWLWLAPQPADKALPLNDPGVERLLLLSEREDAVTNAIEVAQGPRPASEVGILSCTRLGPFPSQADMRRAMVALTPITERIQFKETRRMKSRGWWVYLPAFPTRDLALSQARALSGKGIRDYYVVTAGDQENTISLGLFRERANADKRRAELTSLGFDAALRERTDESPEYWLEYAVTPDYNFNWRDRVPDTTDLEAKPVACF